MDNFSVCNDRWARLGSITVICVGFIFSSNSSDAKTIKVSMAELPTLSETPTKGVLIDMLKAFEAVDPANNYEITVVPFSRSIQNVLNGTADVHMPIIRPKNEANFPFKFSNNISFYKVNFVTYSNKLKNLDMSNLKNYSIEVHNSHVDFFDFPVKPVSQIESGLAKVDVGRIDMFINADVATDPILNERGFKNIRRSFFDHFDATVAYRKDSSDEVDAILMNALEKVRASGKLSSILGDVGAKYNDWQFQK